MTPLFVELCAGTAALSLRLHRDGARPPVSRMGAKTGYADAILRVLGLRPGERAAHYLWCEPDPGVRLLLHAYRDAALAKAAAAIICGWKDEDPRALWERLRAEGPPRLPDGEVEAGEVARFALLWATSIRNKGPENGCDSHKLCGAPATDTFGAIVALPDVLPGRLQSLPHPPATIHPDARTIDPHEVARWSWLMVRSFAFKGPHAGYMSGGSEDGSGRRVNTQERVAGKWEDAPEMPATIHPDARTIDPSQLPEGTVCYMDPPYLNTTGYGHDLPRSEVVTLARRWAAAGAVVCISEAEPIPELIADGWHQVRIDGERKGQKRTFSKQQAEWLTINRPPAWTPPVQGRLFGGAW